MCRNFYICIIELVQLAFALKGYAHIIGLVYLKEETTTVECYDKRKTWNILAVFLIKANYGTNPYKLITHKSRQLIVKLCLILCGVGLYDDWMNLGISIWSLDL